MKMFHMKHQPLHISGGVRHQVWFELDTQTGLNCTVETVKWTLISVAELGVHLVTACSIGRRLRHCLNDRIIEVPVLTDHSPNRSEGHHSDVRDFAYFPGEQDAIL